MGTDAIIVARKAKRYFYFDRFYNFYTSPDADEVEVPPTHERDRDECCCGPVENGRVAYHDINKRRASSEQIVRVATTNIAYWPVAKGFSEDNSHRADYNMAIRQFAEDFPNDEFYVVTTSDEPWCFDIIKRDSLVEWSPRI